jgi:hypothetical protein
MKTEALPGGIAFEDPEALDDLRTSTFEGVGLSGGLKILYGIGLLQGLVDGLALSHSISLSSGIPCQPVSAPIRMVFTLDGGSLESRFSGTLHDSTEAALHVRSGAASQEPTCAVSAGYAAGWYSGLLDRRLLVREIACSACGAPACRFEARPVDDWIECGDRWAEALLPYVDFSQLHERALELMSRPDEAVEGSMMGGFDPMSPAVHVWGPVMILPYSGFQDSDAAIDAILSDVGPEQIEVVVVDLTGARIETVEALGLLQLVNDLEGRSIETILVGMSDATRRALLGHGEQVALPLQRRDVSEGITLAFQVCSDGRSGKV